MKLSKALIGAIVVGVATQATTSCGKKNAPEPTKEQANKGKETPKEPMNCPACGMG